MKNKENRLEIYEKLIGMCYKKRKKTIHLCFALRDMGIDIYEMEELWLFHNPNPFFCWFYTEHSFYKNGKTKKIITYSNELRIFALTMCIEMIKNSIE